MSPSRRPEPGPEEERELAREDEEERRAGIGDITGVEALDDEDDGELTEEELLEIDQTELDELGLTLDDPHQPDDA